MPEDSKDLLIVLRNRVDTITTMYLYGRLSAKDAIEAMVTAMETHVRKQKELDERK
jgi:hypothetical protein